MPTASETINTAIREVTNAREFVKKVNAKQIRKVEALHVVEATAHAWFNTHRPIVANAPGADLSDADTCYARVLNLTTKAAAKHTYLDVLKGAKSALANIRTAMLVTPPPAATNIDDLAPDFTPLAGNPEMRDILTRRWHECCKCVKADAHLAAIVMMGGMLEALFVARANKMIDKKPLLHAAAAPRDKTTGKTLNYQDWMLDSYTRVAHELKWITESARDVADVLKEYRNYIHPEKERRHGVVLAQNDSSMFWQVTKALCRQLLASAA